MAKTQSRPFDFTKCKQRHIALKILYFGWDYDGLAAQQDSENTIEYHLFQALTKTCLIESRDKCSYNRCGRTDKGVSSYGQVVNLNVRSNLLNETSPENVGLFTPENFNSDIEINESTKERKELNYVSILNRVLPDHIKALAWTPVASPTFSSRFSCLGRSYSYLFPKGDLIIKEMQEALSYLIGEHDFRNLCSFDLKHGVVNHRRTILSAKIEPLTIGPNDNSIELQQNHYSFYQIVIVGQAFLYHQIRCIMTIIFLVGSGKEPATVVRDLLDLEKCPARPNYNRASPLPLCLFDCKYDTKYLPFDWIYDQEALISLIRQLKHLWLLYKTKTLMIERVLFDLDCKFEKSNKLSASSTKGIHSESWKDFGLECDNMSEVKYIPLLKRPVDETLETKLEVINKKRANQPKSTSQD